VNSQLDLLLQTRELQYAFAIGAVAVLVLLLLRRQPGPNSIALFLGGALIALAGTPLLENSLSVVDNAIRRGSTVMIQSGFWRTLIVGAGAALVGIICMARAWRDSPER